MNRRPQDEETIIEDLDLAEEDVIMIELPKQLKPETYVFVPMDEEEKNEFE